VELFLERILMKEFLQELNLIIQRLEVLIIGHKLQIIDNKEVNILKTKLLNLD
jgi:hypothetical protein